MTTALFLGQSLGAAATAGAITDQAPLAADQPTLPAAVGAADYVDRRSIDLSRPLPTPAGGAVHNHICLALSIPIAVAQSADRP